MPRRTADQRHGGSAPSLQTRRALADPSSGVPLDALVALHHPLRRRLYELLAIDGPASVGRLAERLGVAVGSVSHHVKPLHAQGFVEPAPELARDTRESWWRAVPRTLSWSVDDFDGPADREAASAAERANLQHHVRWVAGWWQRRPLLDPSWERSALVSEVLTPATREQLQDLRDRLAPVLAQWRAECAADVEQHPDAEREPVAAFVYAVPTRP